VELYRHAIHHQQHHPIRSSPLHALARHHQSRHLHNTRRSSTPTTPNASPHPATAMSSQPPALSKTASNPKQIPGASSTAASVSTTQAFFSNTNGGVRANSSTRNAAPRNTQAAKPKHKSKSKASYRLVDEYAESKWSPRAAEHYALDELCPPS
jgi:hypothetical protein